MKDFQNTIIYVGKSKSLRKRVQSYFYNNKSHSPKVKKLVKHVKDLEHIVTDTEFEAFLLECKLIQELKPMYNRKMKNPLSYTYIAVRQTDGLRRLEIRNDPSMKDSLIQFGPYTANKHAVEKAVQGIQAALKISCNYAYSASSTPSSAPSSSASAGGSPCLNYSLGLCLGMCLGGEAVQLYNARLEQLIGLLDGTDLSLLAQMELSMLEASRQYDFEKAAKYRDCINDMNFLLNKEKVIDFMAENRNIAVMEQLNETTLKVFLIKRNEVRYSEKFTVETTSEFEKLYVNMKELILRYFNIGQVLECAAVNRAEIDAAQIIYSYLQSSACQYLLIPEAWLKETGHHELESALQGWIDKMNLTALTLQK
ncbi:GIY-YIG nuclease family protein [Paenibacillus fonticola]|uniref:GIY-YIG nuclease family protein n=1 Tax=Paenibacillus fonticola TaxID=379896 RepID=UPI0003627AF5|nr:GIY-YIG nuclease family protein [Paenibacillus fonticola]